ncbi:hypothetical protein [Hymenobacter sp. BRD67]|uniref:hypothetical protein n=1 Tax=Hymenobacter sp. BRD67 TaxID=2675877 RepID=UPI0020B85948|nr:hypothetical protein [Hymenobacter sp. BRD67]
MGFLPLTGDEIFYAAQPVALVVADTLDHALHAATLVQVTYQQTGAPIASFLDPKAELFDPKRCRTASRMATPAAAMRRVPSRARPFS